jgi:hypothetical protein
MNTQLSATPVADSEIFNKIMPNHKTGNVRIKVNIEALSHDHYGHG